MPMISQTCKSALEKSCGAENVEMYLLHGYTHASDAFYSDEQLAQVETFLRSALAIE